MEDDSELTVRLNGADAFLSLSRPESSLSDREAQQLQLYLPLHEESKKQKYGLADELGLPARARIVEEEGCAYDLYLVKPPWLYLDVRGMDPVTTIGPSHRTRPYAACNILVLREMGGQMRVLLGQRLTGFGAGDYALPGGKKKERESAQHAAKRELFEETGMQLIESRPISYFENVRPGRPTVISIGVLASVCEGEPVHKEKEQMGPWKWFELEQLPPRLFEPSRWVIDAYLANDRRLTWAEVEEMIARQQGDDGPEIDSEANLSLNLWGDSEPME